MTKTFRKNIFRTIKNSLGRYIAILLIIMLGVGFFCGLKLTKPVMSTIEKDFVNETEMYDVRMISTFGFDTEDIERVKEVDGVRTAAGSVFADFVWEKDGVVKVTRAHMITKGVNGLHLVDGRMPKNANECVVDDDSFSAEYIGRTISLTGNTEDTLSNFAYTEYKIVGRVKSPLYMSIERGTTKLGSGSLNSFIFIGEEGFNFEYYTEMYVKSDADYAPYSDAYDDYYNALSEKIEVATKESLDIRYERIVNDAWDEIHDAEKTLNEEKEKGEKELADAKDELEAANEELAEAEKELNDAKATIDSGKKELDSAAASIKPGFTSWNDALTYGKNQISQGEKALSDGIAEGQAKLDAAKAELDKGEAEYSSGLKQIADGEAEIEKVSAELEFLSLIPGFNGPKMAAAKAELEGKRQELANARTELANARTTLDNGWAEYNAGIKELEDKKAAGEAELQTARNGISQFESGIKSYNIGVRKYEDGLSKYEDGKKQYEDGVKKYEEGLAEFNEKIADARKEIDEAKEEIESLVGPELYMLGRNTNTGYVSFQTDSQIVENLSGIFPIFFFLIAALVCSTTMTRMIDDDRTEIGGLRAMGYSNGAIAAKYLIYSGSAAILGCTSGYFLGGFAFPYVIWIAYGMLYKIPGYHVVYMGWLYAVCLIASLVCSAGASYLALRNDMHSEAAELIRPKAPNIGKRILLERVTFIWNRLRFLHKVTIRNIFRFKKRMFMMIVGIAGCTALVVTSFGLRDSIADIAEYQYGEVLQYDLDITYNKSITDEMTEKVISESGENIIYIASAMLKKAEIEANDTTKDIYFVIGNGEDISNVVNFIPDSKSRSAYGVSLESVPYPKDNEVVLTDKICKMLDVGIGDTVTLKLSETELCEFTVSGIVMNYVYNYAYMTVDSYEKSFGEYSPESMYIKLKDGVDDYGIATKLADLKNVTNVLVVSEQRKRISNMMNALNYVIYVVLFAAGGLAFIVLFNLGNINIEERKREIATIKVLGFHSFETGAYVFRENIILSVMGVLCGLPLGVLLHKFVMDQINIDLVSFKTNIMPVSFLYSSLIVILFAVITDLIMRKKIADIDMAESLKSVE